MYFADSKPQNCQLSECPITLALARNLFALAKNQFSDEKSLAEYRSC